MARNGAGTFAVLNPIVVGALRSSSAVNANFTDAGDEITNSLPVNGEAGMSGQLKLADGAAIAPGLAFPDDLNTGFRRSATDEMRWVGGGSDRVTLDANGKLTFAGALDASAGAFTHTSGRFGPQTLAGTSAPRATLVLSANDTDEHEIANYQSGSGVGAQGSLRVIGGGSNDVATMRFYVNDVLTFQWTGTLFTHSVDTLFGASGIRADTDGFLDFPEITAPSAPAANIARAYARDDSGTTKLFYKDGAGVELPFQPIVDRQIFTTTSTWTKPSTGQSVAVIEMWGGGGSGGVDGTSGFVGGGGGGCYSRKVIALASLSASVSVTVGSGGASVSGGEIAGNAGGTTSFGAYLAAFGGGGGDASGDNSGGGGGGGPTSAGATSPGSAGGDGGQPRGILGSDEWGDAVDDVGNANPFGGGGGTSDSIGSPVGGAALFGGGGGSATGAFGSGDGGASVWGGGGGAASDGGSGGASIFGGNGGDTATAGDIPAGGGGGRVSSGGSSPSGAGARGEVRITCW